MKKRLKHLSRLKMLDVGAVVNAGNPTAPVVFQQAGPMFNEAYSLVPIADDGSTDDSVAQAGSLARALNEIVGHRAFAKTAAATARPIVPSRAGRLNAWAPS